VTLCGHATLASAHVLWADGHLRADEQARFHTLSGLLTADPVDGWIILDFPAKVAKGTEPPTGIFDALGIKDAKFVGANGLDYLVEVGSEDELRSLSPDFGKLKSVQARGVIVTARGSKGTFDFVSRFFAPNAGVNEDPVTGSAHCALTPYWANKLGKTELRAYQASARGGEMKVALHDDRVWMYGQAVTVLTGELSGAPWD
jgi:PhzF family phenazine biosynthesis protein